jgi:MFS family permease
MMNRSGSDQEAGFLTALRQRDYRLLWFSSVFSWCAYWAMLIGRNWLVLRLSGSAGWVGLVTFANMVPYFVATPFGGMLADRFDRRRLAAVTQAVSMAASLTLAALALIGVVVPWHVAALAFIAGCARAIETPSINSMVPNLVRKDRLLNAIALTSVAMFGSRLLGSLSGGIVQSQAGPAGVFAFTGILWGLAAALLLRVHARMEYLEQRGKHAGVWRQTAQAVAYIGRTPMVALIFVLVSLHCGLTMSTDAVLPVLVNRVLHDNGGAYSLLVMAFGGGSLVATFALAGLRSSGGKGRLLFVTGIASGLSTALLGFSHTFPSAFFASILMGSSQAMFMALVNTLVQEVVPDEIRGRISSVYLMITGGLMSFGNLLAGFVSDRVGVPLALIAPSLVFVVILLLMSGILPSARYIFRTGSLDQLSPAVGSSA